MQREQEEFRLWLDIGTLPLPDTGTKEGTAAWLELKNLYEFCRWMTAHREATIAEVNPNEIVAADGPDERRWKPVGGLGVAHWPYLKACCTWDDSDETQLTRNEIIEAILTKRLQQDGSSYVAATSAVDAFANKTESSEISSLWEAVEELTFEEVVAALRQDALRIKEELQAYRREQAESSQVHPDGPDADGRRFFWWRGTPHALPPRDFKLVSVLWNAPDKSLPLWEVLHKVWGIRPAAQRGAGIPGCLRQRKSQVEQLLLSTGVTIEFTKDETGERRVRLNLS